MTFDAGAIEARLILNRQQFQADLAAARSEGDSFDGKKFEARAGLNYDQVKAALAKIAAEWDAVKRQLNNPAHLNVDTGEVDAKIAATEAAFEALRQSLSQDIQLKADTNVASKLAEAAASSGPIEQQLTINPAEAYAALQGIRNGYFELRALLESGIRLELDTSTFEQELAAAIAQVQRYRELVSEPNQLDVDNSRAVISIADTMTAYNTLRTTLGENITLGGVSGGGTGELAATAAAEHELARAIDDVASSEDRAVAPAMGAANAIRAVGGAAGAGGGAVGFLARQIPLFGGALAKVPLLGAVTGLHLLIDGIVELAGTLLPATIAFATFGAAAVPTVTDLYSILSSTYTVSQAFGTSIYPLTGGFQQMAQAVQPEVYVLFGEALTIANQKSGAFQQLAVASGKALDDLGARFTYAVTQSNTFGTVMQHAANDLAGWGNLIGNIGGIIGNVLKVLPGYAEIILNVLNGVTHAIETVTGSGLGQWILSIGLAAHGAVVYVGLLATAFTLLITRGLASLAPLLLSAAVQLDRIGASSAAATVESTAYAFDNLGRSTALVGGLALIAAGFGYLIYEALTAKSSVQDFFASLQQQAQNASILNLQTTLSTQLATAQQDLATSTARVTAAQQHYNEVAANQPLYLRQASMALAIAQGQQADYASGLQQITDEQQIVNQHVQQAAVIFHGTANAWSALNAAGVTSAQLLDTNKQHWEEALIEAQAYDDALRAATQTTGRYGAAQNALNFVAGDSANALGQLDSSLTKVTQAEDQLLNVLIGGEQTFVGFQQSIMGTLSAQGQVTGGLASAAKIAGASLSGLNAQSLALAQVYYGSAVPAAQKQIDALQMQAISTNQLQTVTATMAGQLLQYTGSNIAARTAVVDLINNALGPGTVSLQNLNKWVSQNSTSMAGYKSIVDQAEASASQLANVLQQDVLQMMAQATAAAYGGQKAFSQFAQALISNQTQGTAFTAVGTQVIQTLVASTGNADAAHRSFDAFTESLGYSKSASDALWNSLIKQQQQLVQAANASGETKSQFEQLASQLGYTKQQADQLWSSLHKVAAGSPYSAALTETGTGTFQITGGVSSSAGGNVTGGGRYPAASGAYITTGSGPTADDNIALVSKGELIVPTHIVNAGAVDHLRGLIPGFASGGYMSPGNTSGNIGSLAGATAMDWTDFQVDMTNTMKSAMTDAMKQAITAATAAMISTAGVSNASAEAALKSAAAQKGWTGAEWTALFNVEMREAGFSLTATNPSSGAYGMAQFINGPSEYYQYGGNPNTAAGQAVAMVNYIAQRYGDPIAAWNHELAFGWYDNGGFLRPGWTLAYNGTGQDEPVGNNSNFGDVVQQLSQISNQLQSIFGWPGPDRRPPVGGNAGGNALTAPYGYLTGGNASTFGGFVGDYTGIVSPLGNGFGLTATQLGLPPPPSSSSGSSGAGAVGTGGTGTGSGGGTPTPTPTPTPPPKHTGPNPAQQAAINVLKGLMSGYIWHNEMAQAGQANALLNWLGVGSYNAQLSEIAQLNTLVLRYRKEKKRAAELSAEHVLTQFGVHVFTPQTSAKGNKPHDSVVKKLESLMSGDIATNNMSAAGQVNSLLTALGVGRYSRELSEINNLDSLLAKFKKAKNSGEIRAIETLLQQYGVKKFDLGGTWPNMTLGVNTSGRTETVVSGAGMDQLVDRLERLLAVANAQLNATRAQPQATASRISNALANTPLHGAGMARRYSSNR